MYYLERNAYMFDFMVLMGLDLSQAKLWVKEKDRAELVKLESTESML